MTAIRSFAFTVVFYFYMTVYLIVFAPLFSAIGEQRAWMITKLWARSSLRLLQVVVGTKTEFSGTENIPQGPAIIAAKHQSYWETLALLARLDRPAFILKKELMSIPIFGWYCKRLGMIPVDRSRRGATLVSMLEGARRAAESGRQIVIFPEGTRTMPGEKADYHGGVFFLYSRLDLPVVPVALNSGLYWPKGRGLHQPGTVRAAFMPAIPRGLDREALLERLRAAIETRSLQLLLQACGEDVHLPISASVEERLRQPVAPGI